MYFSRGTCRWWEPVGGGPAVGRTVDGGPEGGGPAFGGDLQVGYL